jgi:putative transposase
MGIRNRIFFQWKGFYLRRSTFTDSGIIDSIKRFEAVIAVPDNCRELGLSTAMFDKWRAKCSGMDVSMMSRMKELEEENRRLMKMYLEEKLKAKNVVSTLEKKMVKPSRRRKMSKRR